VDTPLKQRLIGAAVLIALAVIFLPMLVQGPAPDSGVADVSTRVPDAPSGGYETRELPLLGTAPATAAPAPQAVAPGAPADAATAPADPAVAAGRWAVSFGAYASARDADAVIDRLRQAGLEGFSEQDTINGRAAWRVRVGPYADRSLAEAGRLRAVRVRNDVNAQVIALDATGDGQGEAPAATAATAADRTATAAQAALVATAPTPSQAAATSQALPARETPRPAPAASASASTPAPTPVKPATAPATAPAAQAPAATVAVPAPAPTPAAASVGFAVQMGAFSSEADASALRDRLRAAGFSAIVQPVRTDKGTLSRVRVGPVASRAEAEQLRGRLAGFGGGMVVSHP